MARTRSQTAETQVNSVRYTLKANASTAIQQYFTAYLSCVTDTLHGSTTTPVVASRDKNVRFSTESPTVMGSAACHDQLDDGPDGGDNEDAGGVVIYSSTSNDAAQDQEFADIQEPDHRQSAEEERDIILPLVEHIPTVTEILDAVRYHSRVKEILCNANIFRTEQESIDFEREYFLHNHEDEVNFWEVAWTYMFSALEDNIPICSREVKKCQDEYVLDTLHMVSHHFGQHIPPALEGEVDVDTKLKLRLVSMSIGYVYLDLFEVLVNPPCGG
jgi:hypothetical protein